MKPIYIFLYIGFTFFVKSTKYFTQCTDNTVTCLHGLGKKLSSVALCNNIHVIYDVLKLYREEYL